MNKLFINLVLIYSLFINFNTMIYSHEYFIQIILLIIFIFFMIKLRNIESYFNHVDFKLSYYKIILIIFLSIILYGIFYNYPLIAESWYSGEELDETLFKKILKGFILWTPVMIWLLNKSYWKISLLSLGFSFLILNRTFPIIFGIILLNHFKNSHLRVVSILIIIITLMVMTGIKIDSFNIFDQINFLYERIVNVEFEGLNFIFANSQLVTDAISDEINRYFFRDGSLLLNQKIAALQRGLNQYDYTSDFGAPTITLYGMLWHHFGNFTITSIFYFFFIYYFSRKIVLIKDVRFSLISWLILVYWMRNGVLLPVFIGVLADTFLTLIFTSTIIKKSR